MKPYNRKKKQKETDAGLPFKKKTEKPWILEYQWKSKEDYLKYPKEWMLRFELYSEKWSSLYWFSKYASYEDALSFLKKKIRSYDKQYFLGKKWRVVNKETKEIINFDDIENYYIK